MIKDKDLYYKLTIKWQKMEKYFDSQEYKSLGEAEKEKYYFMGRDLSKQISNVTF